MQWRRPGRRSRQVTRGLGGQERPLRGDPPPVAADRPVLAHHSVTRDDQSGGVGGTRPGNRSHRRGCTNVGCHLGVRTGGAGRDGAQRLPHPNLERGPRQVHGKDSRVVITSHRADKHRRHLTKRVVIAFDDVRGLNRTERDFLEAAVACRDAQRRAERRRTRRVEQLLALVGVLAIVSSLLAAYAFRARSLADETRDQALSRQVATEAQQLRPTDPALAGQLAVAAYRISPTVQARSTLIEATGDELPTQILGPVGPEFLAESHTLLAVAQSATDTVQLYTRAGGRRPVPVVTARWQQHTGKPGSDS